MNLILFDPGEIPLSLPLEDARASHLLKVLKRREGDTFDAGLVNGPRGKGTLVRIGHASIELSFSWGPMPPPLDAITLVIGMPRPQTARKILQETAALGVSALHFVATEKGEPNYARSTLWRDGEWLRHLWAGAEQAFDTRLPELVYGASLEETLPGLGAATGFALDNYEATQPLSQADVAAPVVIAVGPERGWSAAERDLFRQHGFCLVHVGARPLRAETACVAAVSIVKSGLGSM